MTGFPDVNDEGVIELARVYYDPATRRMCLESNQEFGIADSDADVYEIYGASEAHLLGIDIQALAQVLPQNQATTELVNEVYRMNLAAHPGDENMASDLAAAAGQNALDQESPERVESGQ